MKKINLIVTFIFLTSLSFAQDCDCISNFEWTKKTFEENDAGFQYVIDKKGQNAYNIHNQLILEKIKVAKNLPECTYLLNEWLQFFRKGHIGLELLIQTETEHETFDIDIPQFEKYINTKKEADFEGIWQTGAYKIGIKKEAESYIGFIIETDVDTWESGQIKLKIEQKGNKVQSTYYMLDHSAIESGEPKMIGNNYLQIGQYLLKRLNPVFPSEPLFEDYFKIISATSPYLEELNETTLYLRIPSFEYYQKSDIDSVLAANKELILETENLIIDLRNNGGGSDDSYSGIIPFLYTDPIRTVWVEFLSTKLNNQRFLDFSTSTEFNEETRQWSKEVYEKLQGKLGEFVNLNDNVIQINNLDTINKYPKNVGIIIHNRNGSTTEQFLLEAKQSKKVKLFGTTTIGALDISNMYYVDSPCKEFRLWYGLSKSLRIPDMSIDDIGIQPDYYLDKTIPEYKWVEFVNDILNE